MQSKRINCNQHSSSALPQKSKENLACPKLTRMFANTGKEINCECSEDIRREIYWVYNIVQACYISIVLLFAIIALITVLANRRQ